MIEITWSEGKGATESNSKQVFVLYENRNNYLESSFIVYYKVSRISEILSE